MSAIIENEMKTEGGTTQARALFLSFSRKDLHTSALGAQTGREPTPQGKHGGA